MAKPSNVQEYIWLGQVGSTPCTNEIIIAEEESNTIHRKNYVSTIMTFNSMKVHLNCNEEHLSDFMKRTYQRRTMAPVFAL